MKQRMYVLATLIVVSTLFISGCTSSSISGSKIKDIVDNPGKYEGTNVTVTGKVIEPHVVGYKINDGTASLLVVSEKMPAIGEEVSVKGIVRVGWPAGVSDVYIDTVDWSKI